MTDLVRKTDAQELAKQSALLDIAMSGLGESTRKQYVADWRRFGAWWDGRSAEEAIHDLFSHHSAGDARIVVEAYCQHLKKRQLSHATIRRVRGAMNTVSRALHYAERCPWQLSLATHGYKVQPTRDARGPSIDDWDVLLRSLKNVAEEELEETEDFRGARDVAIFLLLRDAALRRSEVCSLDYPEHVELGAGPDARRVHVLGKGRHDRQWHPINERTRGAILRWVSYRGSQGGPLFCRTTSNGSLRLGERLDGAAIRYIVHKRGAELGFKGLSPHKLRHSGITEAAKNWEGTMPGLVRWARHSSPNTTMVYVDSVDDQPQQIANLIGDDED